jgi:hypothetical protein
MCSTALLAVRLAQYCGTIIEGLALLMTCVVIIIVCSCAILAVRVWQCDTIIEDLVMMMILMTNVSASPSLPSVCSIRHHHSRSRVVGDDIIIVFHRPS